MNSYNIAKMALHVWGLVLEHFAMAGALSFFFFQVVFSFCELHGFQILLRMKVMLICSGMLFIAVLKLFLTQSLLPR